MCIHVFIYLIPLLLLEGERTFPGSELLCLLKGLKDAQGFCNSIPLFLAVVLDNTLMHRRTNGEVALLGERSEALWGIVEGGGVRRFQNAFEWI